MAQGEEVVVTRVVRQTIQIAVTPVVSESKEPVELDISYLGEFEILDPQLATDQNAVNIVENIFTGLTRYDPATGVIQPELATTWETSNDGLTWIFELRDDIFWIETDGNDSTLIGIGESSAQPIRPVNASDIVYAIQRICDPRIDSTDVFIYFVIEGCEKVNGLNEVSQNDLDSIGVRAINDQRLEITLTQPAGYFPSLVSSWQLRPVPVEFVEEMGDQWHLPENIVASGPFLIGQQTVMGSRTVLRRNPYWPIPFSGNIDTVNIIHLEDVNDAYQLWEAKDLDLSPVPTADQTSILSRYSQKVDLIPSQSMFYLAYDFNSPVFSVPEVRQAFGWAIDRERLIREVHDGQGLPQRHFAPPGVIGAPPRDEVGTGYSPDKARQQMDASVFGDCRLMPPITYLVSSSDIALQQAEFLRDMWIEELGCAEEQIDIEQVQFGTLLARTRPDAGVQRPDLWDLGWASYYPDENNWVGDVLHCIESENRQERPCGQVDSLIHQAAQSALPDERIDLYREVERNFFGEDAIEPVSPLYVRATHILRQGWLNYTPTAFGGEQYDTYIIDAEVKQLERNQ
jgi:ABC-type oligopeptide transport system substrate-binding subunit